MRGYLGTLAGYRVVTIRVILAMMFKAADIIMSTQVGSHDFRSCLWIARRWRTLGRHDSVWICASAAIKAGLDPVVLFWIQLSHLFGVIMSIPLDVRRELPYNAIREAIKSLESRGRLTCLEPRLGGEQIVRTVLVSNEVAEIVMPPFPETRDGEMSSNLRSLLDSFIEGHRISVGFRPLKKAQPRF